MKKAMVAVLVAVPLLTGLSVGCGGVLTGSGNLETKQFNFSDFNKVEVGSAFEFEIVRSASYSVSITADDNLFEHINVSKSGETLKIGLKMVSLHWPVTLKATVSMPQLRGLIISGASKGTVSDFSSTENLDIEVSGASNLTGDITASDVEFDVSGASSVQLEGSASNIVVDISGASRVQLAGFTVNNADVSLSGASTGTVNLSGKLDADLSGASKLEYIGEPTMGIINTSGASKLSKK